MWPPGQAREPDGVGQEAGRTRKCYGRRLGGLSGRLPGASGWTCACSVAEVMEETGRASGQPGGGRPPARLPAQLGARMGGADHGAPHPGLAVLISSPWEKGWGCNSHLLSPFALYLGRLDYKFLSPGPRPVFHVGVQVLNFPLWPLPFLAVGS